MKDWVFRQRGIKSDKEKRNSIFKVIIGWLQSLVYDKDYITWFVVAFIMTLAVIWAGENHWIAILALGAVIILSYVIFLITYEGERMNSARYNSASYTYGPNKFNYFSLIVFNALLIATLYPTGIKPLLNSLKIGSIDRIIAVEQNTTVYYNDKNRAFVIFIDDTQQPLILSVDRDDSKYYSMKASYLDNKIKVTKKEVKEWYDDKAEIQYTLDGMKFD